MAIGSLVLGLRLAAIVVGLAMVMSSTAHARNQSLLSCWKKLDPQTFVEIGHVQENAGNYASRQKLVNSQRRPAALLLSYGSQRTAFSAGLLVGWGETGYRPIFDLVSAVGPSALLAPFAFVGRAGDQAIADAYNCKASDWNGMVQHALAHLDAAMVERIRQGHLAGRRLLVALKGSAARPQTVWDIGKIAASQKPGAAQQIRSILAASVNLTSRIAVPGHPVKAGRFSQRNHTFRVVGAGQPFLFRPELGRKIRHWYIVHNSVLFNDEIAKYANGRRAGSIKSFNADDVYLRPVFDVLQHVQSSRAKFRIAVIQPRRWFYPQTEFDQTFMRDIFQRAYRYARMGRLWQSGAAGR